MRCRLRHCRLKRERGGRNEPVLIVLMRKVVGDGVCEVLARTWEDGGLSLRLCLSERRSLEQFSDKACVVCKHTCLVRNARVERRQDDDDVGWRLGNNNVCVCDDSIIAEL